MMTTAATFTFTYIAAATTVAAAGPSFKRVFDFPLNNAAVATFDNTTYPNVAINGPALLLTSFGPFGEDGVYALPEVKDLLANPSRSVNLTTLDAQATWPNQANPVPKGAVPSPNDDAAYVLTAGGFFVSPTKATGSIDLLDVSAIDTTGAVTKTTISTPLKGNFYHQAEWADIDGDGKLDIIAARAYKAMLNPFAKAKAELVWLKPPSSPNGGEWVEQVLTGENGPGVGFCLTDIDGDGKVEVVAAQYFVAQQLSIWYCDAAQWSDCVNGTNVKSVVIDNSENAPFFAVEWTDLNGDGKKELLATTNTADGKGAVFVYEQQQQQQQQQRSNKNVQMADVTFSKTKIADGYKPTKAFLPGRGAPGRATSFHIHDSDTTKAILVSADDGGFVDLLVPDTSENRDTFSYNKIRVLNSTGTVGTPSIMDVDGDGYAEFAVPLFAEKKVAVYSFGR